MHASVPFLSVISGQPPSCSLVVIRLRIYYIGFICLFVRFFSFAPLIVQTSHVSRFATHNQSRSRGSKRKMKKSAI